MQESLLGRLFGQAGIDGRTRLVHLYVKVRSYECSVMDFRSADEVLPLSWYK